MVKGVTRRVIVINNPDPHLFEEAIFIVREDALKSGGVTGDEIIREAREAAGKYVRSHLRRRRIPEIPAPVFAVFGAALTGAAWLLTHFII